MPAKLVYKKTPRGEYAPAYLPPDAPQLNPIVKGPHNTFDIEHELPAETVRQIQAGDIHLGHLVERYPPPGPLSGTWEKKNENTDGI